MIVRSAGRVAVRAAVGVPVGAPAEMTEELRAGLDVFAVARIGVGVGIGSPQAVARTIKKIRTPETVHALFIVVSFLVEIAEL